MARNPWNLKQQATRFATDIRVIGWFIVLVMLFAGYIWLRDHPEHNPFAPLDLRHPPGYATSIKLSGMVSDGNTCRTILIRSEVAFSELPPTGEGSCALTDRTIIAANPLSPQRPAATCAVGGGLQLWLNHGLQQAAETHLESRVVGIEHLGTNSCRRINGGRTGPWSEHATGNAIDIAAFVLADGRRISVRRDWGNEARGDFLKAARDAACDSFKTVLSPEYNAQHADHFHLDQGTRWATVCR